MENHLPCFDPRQVMRRPDYEITHKRDTYLQDVELHHHDFYEVYFLLSGDVTYAIESRIYHVLPGDILIINPRELHQVYIKPDMAPYERYVLWIAPSLLQQLSTQQTDLCRCFDTARPNYGNMLHLPNEQRGIIQSLMEAICQETEHPTFGSDLMHTNLLTSLLILVNRYAEQPSIATRGGSVSNRVVAQVINYINLHYEEPLSLDMLADRFFVSKYHLSHEFNKQMGTGLYQYIQKKRLLIARQLLAQGKKPVNVYSACGFGDYTAFFRAFRKVYGVSPKEYVQSLRPGEFQSENHTE